MALIYKSRPFGSDQRIATLSAGHSKVGATSGCIHHHGDLLSLIPPITTSLSLFDAVVMQYMMETMATDAIVWDLETVSDLPGCAAANDLNGKSNNEIHEALNSE